jgi:hypothetical protein
VSFYRLNLLCFCVFALILLLTPPPGLPLRTTPGARDMPPPPGLDCFSSVPLVCPSRATLGALDMSPFQGFSATFGITFFVISLVCPSRATRGFSYAALPGHTHQPIFFKLIVLKMISRLKFYNY